MKTHLGLGAFLFVVLALLGVAMVYTPVAWANGLGTGPGLKTGGKPFTGTAISPSTVTLSGTAPQVICSATGTCTIQSGISPGNATTTIAAVTLAGANTLDSNDLVLNIFDVLGGTSIFKVDEDGDTTMGTLTAASFVNTSNFQLSGSNVVIAGTGGSGSTGLRGNVATGATAIATQLGNNPQLTTVGAKVVGFYNDNLSTLVSSIDKDGSLQFSGNPTLRTCAAALEGLVSRDVASGLATGKRTKLCLCTSDGASVYVWQNLATGTLGTTTVCGTE